MVDPTFQKWKRDIYRRTESEQPSIPEQYGDYFYFSESKRYDADNYSHNSYNIFLRQNVLTGDREKVLDLKDIPQVADPTNAIFDKIKMSDDHKKLAFTIDLENNEKLSTGVIDIKSGKVLDWIDNACQAEFDINGTPFYFSYF